MDQVPFKEIYTIKVYTTHKKETMCASPIQGASNLEIQVGVSASQIKNYAAANIQN